jgi:ubiquinone/menaquinone biosynthesis C-methylase UbiE
MPRGPERNVDYDQVAPTYDERFAYYAGAREGVGAALVSLIREVGAERALDVGCGTGHWLRILGSLGCAVHGLDLSLGMLRRARAAGVANLIRGNAAALPFSRPMLDLVFCVNALHHFADAALFIREARSLLRPGGALAVVGMNPHEGRDRWYLYEYFAGTRELDLERYPSPGTITNWMIDAGFDAVRWHVVERLRDSRVGREILDEPMLQKNATSQLSLLTDEQHSAGIARIRAAVAKAEAIREEVVFSVDISLHMVAGFVEKQ